MTQPIVLITFYSRCGSTEKLALSAAVGAVQARGSIRLRRVPDVSSFNDCAEALARMRKEYVAPLEADILGANALVVAMPSGFSPTSPEWVQYYALIERLRFEGKLQGKLEVVIDSGISIDSAIVLGRNTVDRVRALAP